MLPSIYEVLVRTLTQTDESNRYLATGIDRTQDSIYPNLGKLYAIKTSVDDARITTSESTTISISRTTVSTAH